MLEKHDANSDVAEKRPGRLHMCTEHAFIAKVMSYTGSDVHDKCLFM